MSPRERRRPGAQSPLVPRVESVGPVVVEEVASPAVVKAPQDDPAVYLSARVPKSLRDELAHEAIRQGRPLAQLVQDAVRGYLTART